MRKDKMNSINVTRSNGVQAYHNRMWGGESYAFAGFASGNYYYTSDRKIALDSDYQRKDGKPMKGFGLEIETECYGGYGAEILAEIYERIIFPHFPEGLFKMQEDGSLNDESAECITQVMTKECIRNNYRAFKAMFNDYFRVFNISASRTGNCGMHVNISNACFGSTEQTIETAIRKLYFIVNYHFDFMCGLTRRNRALTSYCRKMNDSMEYAKTVSMDAIPTGHGICFNVAHYNAGRIELRIVGGQKDFGAFRNTMESVFHLVDAVKKLSWDDCTDLVKVFKGCNNYVFDRLSLCVREGLMTEEQFEAIRPTVKKAEYL